MGRRRAHPPLNIFINNRLAGRLLKQSSGAIEFRYDQSWLDWEHGFPISISLSLRESPYTGEAVIAVFDNLLPDNAAGRRRVTERTGAYSLLERIGRDCVGAMQFLPDDVALAVSSERLGSRPSLTIPSRLAACVKCSRNLTSRSSAMSLI